MVNLNLSTRNVAFVSVFAALYYVLSIIPGIPIVFPQIKVELEACIASVFGLILGPYLGSLTALLGSFVAWILPPGNASLYGLPFLFSPVINALVVGLIYMKKYKEAFLTLALLVAAFWFTPPPQPWGQFYYVGLAATWDPIIALLLIIPTMKAARIHSSSRSLGVLYFLLSFIGNEADNVLGSDVFAVPIVYERIFGFNLDAVRLGFVVSPFVYPAIRFIQAIIAMIIAVPLISALEAAGLTPIRGPVTAQ